MSLERVQIKMWRMAKGVPYGTLLWFDETKELPELYKLPPGSAFGMGDPTPLDSGVESDQFDILLSVSASEINLGNHVHND